MEGLYLMGFEPKRVRAHPRVLQFYKQFSSSSYLGGPTKASASLQQPPSVRASGPRVEVSIEAEGQEEEPIWDEAETKFYHEWDEEEGTAWD